MVLEGRASEIEFYQQLEKMTASIINKHYGKGIWKQANLAKDLQHAAISGAYIAAKKFVPEKGEFFSTISKYSTV